MFALGQEDQVVPTGVSVEEAGDIASSNALYILGGSMVAFYLIYKFLIK